MTESAPSSLGNRTGNERHRFHQALVSAAFTSTLLLSSLLANGGGVADAYYAPPASVTRSRPLCGAGHSASQRSLVLRRYNERGSTFFRWNDGARKTRLFSTADYDSGGRAAPMEASTNGTMTATNDEALDNLLPPTMISNSRMMSRPGVPGGVPALPKTGPSSSVLLPLSESIPSASVLKSNNNMLSEYSAEDAANNQPTTWKERLVDVSNLASLLCVLDCTLLPFVSIAIPALSWGMELVTGTSAVASTTAPWLSSFLSALPAISHGIALYFVIPVGLLTTLVNYFFGHKEVRFSLTSLLGVALIYVANSHVGVGIPGVDAWLHSVGIASSSAGISHGHHAHVHDTCGAALGAATGMMSHTCPEGLAHRLTNTVGCALLLGSNYYSKKYMEERRRGCAASALAEAWGGDAAGGRAVCPPGCNCRPAAQTYGAGGASGSRVGGDTFFQWERNSGDARRGRSGAGGGRSFSRFRR
eukprot:CAMPEP_0183720954 /NCGR_PEP_ID=MMETSP0737-20130205/13429_1 /TAXON_ID=385413 /ORGANISM="Thalassiosira miniscula, Strain CCMP1093" /LENGTH=474 /DNA_ID=CAMNT_0025950911 /DNA_START=62 /DNA_END=1486 /DNA_ORIENTATION=-